MTVYDRFYSYLRIVISLLDNGTRYPTIRVKSKISVFRSYWFVGLLRTCRRLFRSRPGRSGRTCRGSSVGSCWTGWWSERRRGSGRSSRSRTFVPTSSPGCPSGWTEGLPPWRSPPSRSGPPPGPVASRPRVFATSLCCSVSQTLSLSIFRRN